MSIFLRVFVVFLPCAVVSGYFYLKVLLALRTGKESKSKARISRVLCLLWLSWILVNLPLAGLEVSMSFGMGISAPDIRTDSLLWTPNSVDAYIYQSLGIVSMIFELTHAKMELVKRKLSRLIYLQ